MLGEICEVPALFNLDFYSRNILSIYKAQVPLSPWQIPVFWRHKKVYWFPTISILSASLGKTCFSISWNCIPPSSAIQLSSWSLMSPRTTVVTFIPQIQPTQLSRILLAFETIRHVALQFQPPPAWNSSKYLSAVALTSDASISHPKWADWHAAALLAWHPELFK